MQQGSVFSCCVIFWSIVCMPASWCSWNWLCGYVACLTFSLFSEHLCMLTLFDDQFTFYVADLVVDAEIDLLIHYRHQTIPLNIGPPEPRQKNLRIITIFLCTRTRVIEPKGKWVCSRGSFQEHPKWDSYITLNGHRAELAAKEMVEPWFFRRVKEFVYRCRDLISQSRVC
ncbi:hypothetical protein MKX03_015623 [Papaver bracteatum]|nr:hypothetical protein MKX03_015623 [Papaver bracteatum]